MTLSRHLPLAAALPVPSPLAGEGQGEGYHTARSLDSNACISFRSRIPPVALPLSPTLPRKGGGSPPSMPRDHEMQVECLA